MPTIDEQRRAAGLEPLDKIIPAEKPPLQRAAPWGHRGAHHPKWGRFGSRPRIDYDSRENQKRSTIRLIALNHADHR